MAGTQTSSSGAFDVPLPPLRGNRVCLDFVNTLDPRKGDSREFLHRYTDLIAWSVQTSLLTRLEAEPLLRKAAQQPDRAAQVFGHAIELREMLYRLFYAVSQGNAPLEAEGAALQQTYVQALPYARMTGTDIGFDWFWPAEALETPLWRLAHDAVELLRTGEPTRLKECANPTTCGWLFYDTSKNNSRRWCSMASCGVPEKVRQQRRKRQNRAL